MALFKIFKSKKKTVSRKSIKKPKPNPKKHKIARNVIVKKAKLN
jgi:hypothetical protein